MKNPHYSTDSESQPTHSHPQGVHNALTRHSVEQQAGPTTQPQKPLSQVSPPGGDTTPNPSQAVTEINGSVDSTTSTEPIESSSESKQLPRKSPDLRQRIEAACYREKLSPPNPKWQRHLLAHLLRNPELRDYRKRKTVAPEDLDKLAHQVILQAVHETPDYNPQAIAAADEKPWDQYFSALVRVSVERNLEPSEDDQIGAELQLIYKIDLTSQNVLDKLPHFLLLQRGRQTSTCDGVTETRGMSSASTEGAPTTSRRLSDPAEGQPLPARRLSIPSEGHPLPAQGIRHQRITAYNEREPSPPSRPPVNPMSSSARRPIPPYEEP